MGMICIILFHNAHTVVFFARLVKRKKFTVNILPRLSFQLGRKERLLRELFLPMPKSAHNNVGPFCFCLLIGSVFRGGGDFYVKKTAGARWKFWKSIKILFCGHDLRGQFQFLHNTDYSLVIFFLLNTLRDRPLFSWKRAYEKSSSANFYFLFMHLCRYFLRTTSSCT